MTNGMKIKAIAPWLGSKRTMARDIVAELGPHKAYFGLCFASLAVELAKPQSGAETVVELHTDISNLAMVLASDRWRELYERSHRTLMAETLFAYCRAKCTAEPITPPVSIQEVSDEHVERAWAYFVWSWQGRNGVAGTSRSLSGIAVRYTPGGGHGGLRFANAVESMPSWHERLRRMVILNRDIFEVLPKIDDHAGVAIYCDPPYIVEGRQYVHPFRDSDHSRLASEFNRFQKSRVVVSYYDHPLLDDLYPPSRWTKRLMYRAKNLHQQNRRGQTGAKDAPEVLLINGPSYAKEEFDESLENQTRRRSVDRRGEDYAGAADHQTDADLY